MKRCTAAELEGGPTGNPLRVTFIVRAWCENRDSDPPEWRAVVEHVQRSERRAAADTEGLLELLATWLREEPERGGHGQE